MNKYVAYSFGLASSLMLLQLGQLFKVNLVLGSHEAVLSGFSILGPLTGLYGGAAFSITLFGLKSLFFGIVSPTTLVCPVAWNLPSIAASLYWATKHRFFALFLPLICIIAFIMHPVGLGAWEYSLFWFVPVLIYVTKPDNLFAHALASTFVAHGVGSVLWLYTAPLTSEQWLALLPLVVVERLVVATGMIIVCKSIAFLKGFLYNNSLSFVRIIKPISN